MNQNKNHARRIARLEKAHAVLARSLKNVLDGKERFRADTTAYHAFEQTENSIRNSILIVNESIRVEKTFMIAC